MTCDERRGIPQDFGPRSQPNRPICRAVSWSMTLASRTAGSHYTPTQRASTHGIGWSDCPARPGYWGAGPRPHCLHVAHVRAGGHTGRPHTFIVGLDDSRFPGAGLQDPLLLDSERRQLSPNLEIAATRLENKLRDFARLLARLRGRLTLSFCARSVNDDREMFPDRRGAGGLPADIRQARW